MSKEEMSLRTEVFTDWGKFLEKSEAFLLAHEIESNLIWEIGRVTDSSSSISRSWMGWVVLQEEDVFLAALPSVTGYLILSGGSTEACPALANDLFSQSISLNGVSGPKPQSCQFAEAWERIADGVVSLGAELSLYQSPTEPASTNGVSGAWRQAHRDERDLLRGWAIDFGAESAYPMDPRSLNMLNERMLSRGDLFVWEVDDEVVAMGGFGRETPHGLVINMIYTPINRRGCGFAGALTSGLRCEAGRRGKEFCCLYSDFASSVRANLYERIGFHMVGEFAEYKFSAQSERVPSDRQ